MTLNERTRTAHASPFAAEEEARTPLLLVAARTGPEPYPPEPRWVVPAGAIVIGRRPRGGPALAPGLLTLDDALASTNHARVYRETTEAGARWMLADLGSKNGTLLDGEPVTAPVALRDGARIFLGGHLLVFRLASAAQIEALKEDQDNPLGPVPTLSPRLAMLSAKLRRLARSDNEILLVGETGAGKEVYARAIAAHSGRAGQFVALNCAAIPRELVESELFGYRPGAHSTAQAAKAGLIEQAEGGTLFLDEIGEMTNEAQSKLLRFLQDRQLTPLGATRPRAIDVRIIAATNRELLPGSGGHVRDDLLGRLGAAPWRLPPLRERIEDLGALLQHFLGRSLRQHGVGTQAVPGFDLPALRALALASYPLNVRELEKVVAAAVALATEGRPIGTAQLPETILHPASLAGPIPAAAPLEGHARGLVASPVPGTGPQAGRKPPEPAPSAEELRRFLVAHAGNVAEVARSVGRQRAAVWRWLKRYGLDPADFKSAGS